MSSPQMMRIFGFPAAFPVVAPAGLVFGGLHHSLDLGIAEIGEFADCANPVADVRPQVAVQQTVHHGHIRVSYTHRRSSPAVHSNRIGTILERTPYRKADGLALF